MDLRVGRLGNLRIRIPVDNSLSKGITGTVKTWLVLIKVLLTNWLSVLPKAVCFLSVAAFMHL